ncbi:MAG TPA: hypothetical protein ENK43_16870 [Planctomycetes bacterium]|nr:hypothetical protein [Planctomycetota bacterium]
MVEDLVRIEFEWNRFLDAWGRADDTASWRGWTPVEHGLHVLQTMVWSREGLMRNRGQTRPDEDSGLATTALRRLVFATFRIPSKLPEAPVGPPDVILPPEALIQLIREEREAWVGLCADSRALGPPWFAFPRLGHMAPRDWARFHVIHGLHHMHLARESRLA